MAVQSTPIRQQETETELIARLKKLRKSDSARLHRIEIPVAELDPLEWLASQRVDCRAYWRDRDSTFEFGAAGAARRYRIDSREALPKVLQEIEREAAAGPPGVRYLGGLRFDADRMVSSEWKPFEIGQFILPRFELSRDETGTILACHLRGFEAEQVISEIRRIRWERMEEGNLPTLVERCDYPNRFDWEVLVDAARGAFRKSPIQKLVLSRRSQVRVKEEFSAWRLLAALRKDADGCYLFGLEPERGSAFVGVSPERLFSRVGSRLFTEIFAGTRRRSPNPEEDTELARNLVESEKDRLEHRLAVDCVRQELTDLCPGEVEVTERQLVKLSSVQHLRTAFSGLLKPGVRLHDLLQALHPTPAVGGWPTEESLVELRNMETFDRGWYAGPLGWISRDRSELIVAIRSALIRGREMVLYSGAGIVEGSDSQEEWNELEAKLTPFLGILNDTGHGST